jgi:hypothetical protein
MERIQILELVSASPANIRPVFDLMAEHAVRLCEGELCAAFRAKEVPE